MKLAEVYANYCGVKLPEKPAKPYCAYYPIDGEYITFHNGSGMPSKNYDYYAEAISILKDQLRVNFVQIGTLEEPLLPDCLDLRGKTSLYQCNYILENALCHVGNDSVWAHNAGSMNVPEVILYGPTLKNVCSPYYYNEKSVFLEGKRLRATHSAIENPKTINTILPEDVANGVFEILGVEKSTRKSLHIGDNYNNPIIDIIPDSTVPENLFNNHVINIRLDMGGDERISRIIAASKKSILVTKNRLELTSLKRESPNLQEIRYKVDSKEEFDSSFTKELATSGLNYLVITESEEVLEFLKFELLSYQAPKKIARPILPETDFEGTSFKSSKIIGSNGKFYLSEWHFKNNIPMNSLKENIGKTPPIEDSFWKNSNNYYIYA